MLSRPGDIHPGVLVYSSGRSDPETDGNKRTDYGTTVM